MNLADYAVIIAAAGRSERFGKAEKKVFAKLDGRPLFIRAIECFVNRDDVGQVILAVSPDDLEVVKEKYSANLGFMGVEVVVGGEHRWQTVCHALEKVKEDIKFIAVHDSARICVTSKMIDQVFEEAARSGAAILAAPLTGTIKSVSSDKVVDGTVQRAGLYEAQTPQVFSRDVLSKAYQSIGEGTEATDDAGVVEASGHAVTVVEADMSNLKITYPGDLALAGAIAKSRPKPKPSGPRGPFGEAQW